MIASDFAGNWQSTENSSKEYFTFSVAAPKILDVRSNASNKSYQVGDQIIFMIDFDSPVKVSGTDSSLNLTSSSSNAQLHDAKQSSEVAGTSIWRRDVRASVDSIEQLARDQPIWLRFAERAIITAAPLGGA